MAKRTYKKNEIINTRISLLFFYTLFVCGLLWAENFARYRYDYIFRGMLPWILPCGLILSLLLLVGALWIYFKNKNTQERIFSGTFTIYLVLPLPAAFLFPWLSTFGKGLQLFSLAIFLVFCGLGGYFISYILYHKIRPAAALLAWGVTASALALTYFYKMYLSPARYILNSAEFGYLSIGAVAGILCGILAILLLFGLWLAQKDRFRLPQKILLILAGFSALLILITAIFDPWLSGLWIRILLFGGVALEICGLILTCVFFKIKK